MKKLFLILLVFAGFTVQSANVPVFMRDIAISPNGQQIAFEYKGDIYKVSVNGGEAVRLTVKDSYECHPVWSPNSDKIAFNSDRFGGFDIFLMSASGGSAKRLTTNSTKEIPVAFSPNAKEVYFTAAIQDPASSIFFPSRAYSELYSVSINGGRTMMVMPTPAERIDFAKDGKSFLYMDCKGVENYWRKHHTSSVTRDIWSYDIASKKNTQIINRAGEDRDPRYGIDDKNVFFLTEKFGTFNVASFSMDNPSDIKQITHFKTTPVRFLSVADNGTLCYSYDGAIYTQKSASSRPQKLKLTVLRDNESQDKLFSVRSGASEATVSNDGKMIAFIKRGEVFVTSVDYATTKQITHTPEAEQGISFSPDGKTLVYGTERTGIWQLCQATMERKEDLDFSHATTIKEKMLLSSKTVERQLPQFSPDGKEIAFVENRKKIVVYNIKSKKTRDITDGHLNKGTNGFIDFSWSPDSKWFTLSYISNNHDPYSDIGLVSAKGGQPIKCLTGTAYFDESPKWVMDGHAILFKSNRFGMRNQASWGSQYDAFLVFLNKDAYDKYRLNKEDYEMLKELEKEQKAEKEKAEKKANKKKSNKKSTKTDKKKKDTKLIKIDWDNLSDRLIRLTNVSSELGSVAIDNKGEKLYFMTKFQKGFDLWTINLREHSTSKLKTLDSSWSSLSFDKSGKNLFILGSTFRKMVMAGNRIKGISYSAQMKMNPAAEREYMFNHVCLQEKKRFYETKMHGVNWDKMANEYRKFLPYINNNYDFAQLLSELLGELNVSHTGSGYLSYKQGDSTAQTGLLFDWNYKKEGLRVSSILEDGPFDRATTKVEKGVILESIDGVEIAKNTDYYPMLNHKKGIRTLFGFYNPISGKHWTEVIKPISSGAVNEMLYNRWVKREAAKVDSLSNGRLGYVHIRSMDDASFRKMYADVLGKYNNREGIVIDTRFNGGGRLHEDVEVFFTGEKYLTQVIRGKEACTMPSRRWTKASIMLQCEYNYSNAHGTPWVYKHQKIGKLVGMPVPGTMTSVNWETLQDKSLYFGIPVIGYRQSNGVYLEGLQLEPDVRVANSPDTIWKGEDLQLQTAVKTLLKDIDSKK